MAQKQNKTFLTLLFPYFVYPTIADQTYTGTELKPAVKVTKNGEVIETGYSVEYSANTNVGTATATVKVGDTVIGTATFNIAKAKPTISITAEPASLVSGGAVKLTVNSDGIPAEGKIEVTCEGVIVTKNSDGTFSAVLQNRTATYTFTVSYKGDANHEEASAKCEVSVTRRYSSSTTVTPEPEPTPDDSSKYADVPTNAYFADAVKWAVDKGVTNGLSDTTFGPYESCTRGQSVTFLYRALKGAVSGSANFTDVASDAFYADAVNWAVANNVTNGTSATTFSPNADCTRAEIVTFLYRAYQGK